MSKNLVSARQHDTVAPLGEVLAGPHFDDPAVLTAELDLGEIARGTLSASVERGPQTVMHDHRRTGLTGFRTPPYMGASMLVDQPIMGA